MHIHPVGFLSAASQSHSLSLKHFSHLLFRGHDAFGGFKEEQHIEPSEIEMKVDKKALVFLAANCINLTLLSCMSLGRNWHSRHS